MPPETTLPDVIAVTGATGAVGGEVARRLAEAGAPLRLLVRDPARAPQIGAAVHPIASYDDSTGMRAALAGATTLFLISAAESRDRVQQHVAAVDAAVAAGVERIVYLSFLGAAPDATFTLARQHAATEQHVRSTELRHTFLRDSMYADFAPALVGDDGVIRGPAGDGRASFVARADVAAAAVSVLLDRDSTHDGATYDLTGPEALTLAEPAQRLGRLVGRAISYVEESPDEAWASRRASGAEDWLIEGWVSSYQAIAAGELATVSDDVRALTGRRPQTLERTLLAAPHLLDRLRRL